MPGNVDEGRSNSLFIFYRLNYNMNKQNTEQSKNDKRNVKIMKCSCSNNYQDLQYTKGMRLFNPFKGGYRCSVCSNEVRD